MTQVSSILLGVEVVHKLLAAIETSVQENSLYIPGQKVYIYCVILQFLMWKKLVDWKDGNKENDVHFIPCAEAHVPSDLTCSLSQCYYTSGDVSGRVFLSLANGLSSAKRSCHGPICSRQTVQEVHCAAWQAQGSHVDCSLSSAATVTSHTIAAPNSRTSAGWSVRVDRLSCSSSHVLSRQNTAAVS